MINVEDLEKILDKHNYSVDKKLTDSTYICIRDLGKNLVGWIRTKTEGSFQEGLVVNYGRNVDFYVESIPILAIENGIKFRNFLDKERILYRENIPREEVAKKVKEYKKRVANLAYRCGKIITHL